MGAWGMSGVSAGPTHTTTREVQTKKGTLVVDIVDAKEKQLVWRGTASGILISDSQEKTEKAVGKSIQEMAKQNRKLRAKEANKKRAEARCSRASYDAAWERAGTDVRVRRGPRQAYSQLHEIS